MLEAAGHVQARNLKYVTHLTEAGIEWQQPDDAALRRSATRLISQKIAQGRPAGSARRVTSHP